MTDFLDEKRSEIQARLKELKPLVDESIRIADELSSDPQVTPAEIDPLAARPKIPLGDLLGHHAQRTRSSCRRTDDAKGWSAAF